MREITFLKHNADKWKKIEAHLAGEATLAPDLLADFFVQLTDDLAYAKTFYPGSKTTSYLNTLTARVHQRLYHNKRERQGRLLRFFTSEYPHVLATIQKEILLSFTILMLATMIGALSALYDDTYVRLILGDTYVNMTLENIENQDPMAVYKKMYGIDMFVGITVNNVFVSFYAFAMGVLLSFGTGYILFQNGVMLGAFHALFYQMDVLGVALKTIWIHGSLEIPAIVVAGAAGLVMGNSILFPGTYTRKQSFVLGARKGLKTVMGMLPFFLAAGFLEAYVTRHNQMPTAVSLFIIFSLLACFILYVVVYPRYVTKRSRPTLE